MNIGRRPRTVCPERHGAYHLIRTHGRVFAIPDHLDHLELLRTGQLFGHPAVFSAATLEETQAEIDRRGPAPVPERIGPSGEFDLIDYRGRVFGVARSAGLVDLDLPDDRRRADAIEGATAAEVEDRLAERMGDAPVEFAGWMPVYVNSGNCGNHPQFTHTAAPPSGYRFTCSAPPVTTKSPFWGKVGRLIGKSSWAAFCLIRPVFTLLFGDWNSVGVGPRLWAVWAAMRLFIRLLFAGTSPLAAVRFLQSRHLRSQMLLMNARDLVFLTSMPYTLNQGPWVVEIEDPTTLFFPFIQNGNTCDLDVRASPYYPAVKALLESEQCKGIVTHMRSTAELVPTLFQSEAIRRKVFYAPLGVKVPTRWQRHEDDGGTVELLFINSWCQAPSNFYLRGGLEVLEAFAVLRERYPQVRLTMRTPLPALDAHYHRIIEGGGVRVIDRFLTAEEMADLHANSHVFLLPAARVHIVSLLQAMSYGLAVVASDGWGFDEYLEDGRNGLTVSGRYGKASWADREAGVMREDYETMYTPTPEVVRGLIDAVSRLVEERALRARLGRTARQDVEEQFNLDHWNAALKEAFDRARGVEPPAASEPRTERPLWAAK